MNLALAGKGNASVPHAMESRFKAGAAALKLQEDWGHDPAVDRAARGSEKFDVQVPPTTR